MSLYAEAEAPSRPTWSDIYAEFATSLSRRSTCERLHVGCVITSWDHNRVLSIGYNGNYAGGPNMCDQSSVPGLCGCLHAEENALIKLDYNDHAEKRLYCTASPCTQCAKRIINAGIRQVIYIDPYRTSGGRELLGKNGIEVIHWSPGIRLA
jgi:dCMP deaminase